MSDQELNLQEEEETSYAAAMYHSAAHHHSNTTYESPEKYTTTTTYKRHSPSSFQEPSLKKKATLDPPSSPTADYHLHGYTKLPLPHYFPIAALPPLRRTISEPLYSPNTTINQDFSDLNIVQESSSPSPSPYPKPPPPLHRTVSDPSPVANRQAIAAAGTPPRPPLPRSASRSPICGESTNHETERMKRMKERLKEMNKWVNEFVNDVATENYKTGDIIPKEEIESEIRVQEHETQQEAVWVDKDGECVILHLDCPCGNRYQILLHGSDCYYKLINVS